MWSAKEQCQIFHMNVPESALLERPLDFKSTAHGYDAGMTIPTPIMDHLHARPKEFHTYYVTSGGACVAILSIEKLG